MFIFTERLLNPSVAIRRILLSYLNSLPTGTSIDTFIQQQDVLGLVQDISSISEEVRSASQIIFSKDLEIERLSLLIDTLMQENQLLTNQISNAQVVDTSRIIELMEAALALLVRNHTAHIATPEHSTASVTSTVSDSGVVIYPDEDNPVVDPEDDNDESSDDDDDDDNDESSDDDDDDDDDDDESSDDDDDDDDDDESSDDDDDDDDESSDDAGSPTEEINFDDEDLARAQPIQTTPVAGFLKNPNIRENLVDFEDENMNMFVYVGYSHLPYHYILNGVHYRFALSGRLIISTVVSF
jgi:hypothetical protein